MKIALIIERMDPFRGGRETYTAHLAAALTARGHAVSVIALAGSWRHPGVEVRILPARGASRSGRVRNFIADAGSIARGGEFDVTHAMLAVPGAGIYHPHDGAAPAERAGGLRCRPALLRPLASLARRINRRRRDRERFERQIMADAGTTCLAVSRMVAADLRRYYGRTDGVRVVFNGVHAPPPDCPERARWRAARRREIGAGEATVVFLTVATNFALKGVAQSIDAFARWRRSAGSGTAARLVVVGRAKVGPYRRRAERRGVGGEIVFIPPTPEVFSWYAAADAYVLLTWYDTCSLTVLEAARWGIPAATTAFCGAAEVLGEGGCIVIASPADVAAAAAALAELADPARRAALAAACRVKAQYLGLDRHLDELEALYREVAGK